MGGVTGKQNENKLDQRPYTSQEDLNLTAEEQQFISGIRFDNPEEKKTASPNNFAIPLYKEHYKAT